MKKPLCTKDSNLTTPILRVSAAVRKVFLLFSLYALLGCSIASFDISQPLVTLVPSVEEEFTEKVLWEELESYYRQYGCKLVYLKHELSCGECDLMDEVFKNKDVVRLLNENFISFQGSDDSLEGEVWMSTMPGMTLIITIRTRGEIVFTHDTTAIEKGAFIGILKTSVDKCNDYNNRSGG